MVSGRGLFAALEARIQAEQLTGSQGILQVGDAVVKAIAKHVLPPSRLPLSDLAFEVMVAEPPRTLG